MDVKRPLFMRKACQMPTDITLQYPYYPVAWVIVLYVYRQKVLRMILYRWCTVMDAHFLHPINLRVLAALLIV